MIELHAGAPGSQQTRDWPWNSVNKGTGREPLRAGERGGGGGGQPHRDSHERRVAREELAAADQHHEQPKGQPERTLRSASPAR